MKVADNFHFDLTGVALSKCLDIAFSHAPGNKAKGWVELPTEDEKCKRLVLFWTNDKVMTPLPALMDAEAAEPFVRAWLAEQDYGPEPDHDGDNEKGWRAYCEGWGHVASKYAAFIAIEPVWLMYGK